MAAYNHEPFIEAMLQSIRGQSFQDWELVIVDDGSTDKTPELIAAVAATDPRIRLIRQENSGIVAARNRALGEVRGELVSIVDSDDLLPSDRTERLVRAFDADPQLVLIYGDARLINAEGSELELFSRLHPPVAGRFSNALFCSYCFVPAVSVMCRRRDLIASGPLWGAGPTTDYLKWIEVGLAGAVKRLDGAPLGFWRQHRANLSQIFGEKRAQQYLDLERDLRELLLKHEHFAGTLDPQGVAQRFGYLRFLAGFYYATDGNWAKARENFKQAHAIAPRALYKAAQFSTYAPLSILSQPVYRSVARSKLKR